jgi:hypothetical protein
LRTSRIHVSLSWFRRFLLKRKKIAESFVRVAKWNAANMTRKLKALEMCALPNFLWFACNHLKRNALYMSEKSKVLNLLASYILDIQLFLWMKFYTIISKLLQSTRAITYIHMPVITWINSAHYSTVLYICHKIKLNKRCSMGKIPKHYR